MRQNKVLAVLQAILSTCFVCGVLAYAQRLPATTTKTPEEHFSYSGDDGPGFWAVIKKGWEACGNGTQSPVNIPGNAEVDPTLTLTLDLKQTSVVMINDDGHTIKVKYTAGKPGPGGTITFNGVPYDIQQFHFHTLSEHTLQGKRGVMELHAVFTDRSTPPNFLAIAMLYEIGNADPFLSTLISAGLPEKSHSKHVPIPALDLTDAFTETSSYYTYAGSLTIPSCFPVTFIVLKTEATMSEGQFLAFQGIMGNNFRPIQALNGRTVRVTPPPQATSQKMSRRLGVFLVLHRLGQKRFIVLRERRIERRECVRETSRLALTSPQRKSRNSDSCRLRWRISYES